MRPGLLLFLLACFQVASSQHTLEARRDFARFFGAQGITGSFLLYDMKENRYLAYDTARCRERFTPASTFKIFNSLVALETGVAPDEHFTLKWDGVRHEREAWNQDQDMATAIRNSTVWFYQEIARRVGEKRMREYVEREHYGNMDISGGIDHFWLDGGLRISQVEQIDFLRRMYDGSLGFSKRSVEIVKRMIILKDTSTYVLRGKTGWGTSEGRNIGWLVGYLEQNDNAYFYAINIEAPDPAPKSFPAARWTITEAIFKSLGLL